MRVLLVGAGGREHALAWKLAQSPEMEKLYIAPGNPGTAQAGENVPIAATDVEKLVDFACDRRIDLVIPGPELPLILGLKDALARRGIACFGPDAYAAQLEGSKSFAKEVMREAGVPTADFAVFDDVEKARAHVRAHGAPVVIKADGLAAGKGVVVAKTETEALEALEQMMVRREFGEAGAKVVVEEALSGEEASFLVFCLGGDIVVPLPSAQDHKAAFDNDTGPNTGGMGAYSPAPVLPDSDVPRLIDEVVRPVLAEMNKRGHPFTGVLYAGLMLTPEGAKVLEFNVRFGDPEFQPLLMRLKGDLLPLMKLCARGEGGNAALTLHDGASLCVVVAADGYPGAYPTGMPLEGITGAEATSVEDGDAVKVFMAGVAEENGRPVAAGGRVLGVTARASTLEKAHDLAYKALEHIHAPKTRFRTDIGRKGLRRQREEQERINKK